MTKKHNLDVTVRAQGPYITLTLEGDAEAITAAISEEFAQEFVKGLMAASGDGPSEIGDPFEDEMEEELYR
jgi:hypothetical protein